MTKLRLCQFTCEDDIVRNMLHSVAKDEMWNEICWQGSGTKLSFINDLTKIHANIKKIAVETFSHKDTNFFDGRIKTFLRHTTERLNRSNRKSNNDSSC